MNSNIEMKRKFFIYCTLLILVLFSCREILFEEDLSDKNVATLAPGNNTVVASTSVNFNWDEVSEATEYQLQIAFPAFSNANQILLDTILTITNFNFTLNPGSYEWRVRAANSYSETPYTSIHFTVKPEVFNQDISNNIVVLNFPSDQSTVLINPVTFNWESSPYSEEYNLQVASPNFDSTNPLIIDETITSTTFSQLLSDGDYEWRVKAKNSASETNFSKAAFTVNTDVPFSDREVVIISPPNNYITNEAILNIEWQPVSDATLYRVQIVNPSNNNIISQQTTTNTNVNLNFPEGEFIFRIRAETNSENTLYTSQNTTVDTIAPNSPELLTPADLEIIDFSNVTFTWSREPIDGTIEGDSLYVYNDIDLSVLVLQESVYNGSYSTDLESNNSYYWVMRSFDEAGNISENSAVFNFTIE